MNPLVNIKNNFKKLNKERKNQKSQKKNMCNTFGTKKKIEQQPIMFNEKYLKVKRK